MFDGLLSRQGEIAQIGGAILLSGHD